jgi:isopenicillin-N N-acyltransferase-like protein
MQIVEVRGNGRERGRAHGEALRPMVHEHLARWREALLDDLLVDPDSYVDEFLADTDFLTSARQHTPDLLEEVRGICEGAATDWRYTFVRQLSDEEPWYRRARKLGAWPGRSQVLQRDPDAGQFGGAVPPKGCSSVGRNASAQQPMLIAQNMDCPLWFNDHQVALKVSDPGTGVDAWVFTVAGKISLAGMNSRGLAMTCNTLYQLDYNPRGLAEDFVVRGYLAQPDVKAGVNFMERIPHASGQNYTVSGPGGQVLNLECSRAGVVRWRPWKDADRVFHTNHALANTDDAIYREQFAAVAELQRKRLNSETTLTRFAELQRWFGDALEPITPERVKAAMASKIGPLCREGEHEGRRDGYTIGCLLMHLGETPFMEIAPGPPNKVPFQTLRF